MLIVIVNYTERHAMNTARKPSPFEQRECTRCGGSGRYSYNMLDGDRCYGCGGKGVQLTKRGAAARAFFLDSMITRYDAIQVGYRVFDPTRGWRTVTNVEVDGNFGGHYVNYGTPDEYIDPNTHSITTGTGEGRVSWLGKADSTMRAYADRAEYDAKLAAALAYQDTLTQQGKPRKRAAR